MFKKRAPIHDRPSAPKVKVENGSDSQCGMPTCATCTRRRTLVNVYLVMGISVVVFRKEMR